jgi:hypothetical protein
MMMLMTATLAAGDYLSLYGDDELTDVSDPGSRCGYSDSELASIRRDLGRRGLTLSTDDRGIRVVEVQS